MSQQETQQSVSEWAVDTFGDTGTNVRVAVRANEEMAELLRELTIDDQSPKAPKEIADIIIVLYRLATRMGVSIQEEIDHKMALNRERVWTLDQSGCGKHVRNK
jgi:hypothetical protein